MSEEAVQQEKDIKESVNSLLDVDAFQQSGLSAEVRGMAVGSAIDDLLAEDASDRDPDAEGREHRARLRWSTVLMLLFALVVLGGALLAAAMLVINSRAGSASQISAPAGADCTVKPGTVTVETVVLESTSDEHRSNVRGQTTITNTGPVPVYVGWRESQSTGHDNSGNELTDEGWFGGPFLMQPGETRNQPVGAQVFANGERTWTLITDVAVFAQAPECSDHVFKGGDGALAALAEPVANPFPAGPGS